MQEEITYVSKEKLNYTIQKTKEYIASNYVTKTQIGNIDLILDYINGEVI